MWLLRDPWGVCPHADKPSQGAAVAARSLTSFVPLAPAPTRPPSGPRVGKPHSFQQRPGMFSATNGATAFFREKKPTPYALWVLGLQVQEFARLRRWGADGRRGGKLLSAPGASVPCLRAHYVFVTNVADIFSWSVASMIVYQAELCDAVCFYMSEIRGWLLCMEARYTKCSETPLTAEYPESLG